MTLDEVAKQSKKLEIDIMSWKKSCTVQLGQ